MLRVMSGLFGSFCSAAFAWTAMPVNPALDLSAYQGGAYCEQVNLDNDSPCAECFYHEVEGYGLCNGDGPSSDCEDYTREESHAAFSCVQRTSGCGGTWSWGYEDEACFGDYEDSGPCSWAAPESGTYSNDYYDPNSLASYVSCPD